MDCYQLFFHSQVFSLFLSAQNMFKECREVGKDCYCRHYGRHPYTPRGDWLIDWLIDLLCHSSIDWLIDWLMVQYSSPKRPRPLFLVECDVERRKEDFKRYRGCLVTPFPRTRFPVTTPVVVLTVLCLQVIGTCNLVNHSVRRGWIYFIFTREWKRKAICIFSPSRPRIVSIKTRKRGEAWMAPRDFMARCRFISSSKNHFVKKKSKNQKKSINK